MTKTPREDHNAKATRFTAVDMISDLLTEVSSAELPRIATEQIRELTGAKTILLVIHPDGTDDHSVLYALPTSRAGLFSPAELALFCPDCTPDQLPKRPSELPSDHSLREILMRIKVESFVRMPLRVEGNLVGVLLLMDLHETDRLDEVEETVSPVIPILAIALRNALSHKKMTKLAEDLAQQAQELEARIEERTADLQDINKTLAESRVAALNMMEDAVAERQRAEKTAAALAESQKQYRFVVDNMADVLWSLNVTNGKWEYIGPSVERLRGYTAEEVMQQSMEEVMTPESYKLAVKLITERTVLFEGGKSKDNTYVDEIEQTCKDGSTVWTEVTTKFVSNERGEVVVAGVSRDITERKQMEHRRQLSIEIHSILSEPVPLDEAINRVLSAIKQATGFDAVGLRLQTGDDFPYIAQHGFSEDFLLAENTLVAQDNKGGLCRNKDGSVSLECTCGVVLSGKTDPANPLFTPGGSCWTNNSLPILDMPEDQDPRLHPRNRCIHEGFLSVALIPIRASGKIVGLLQLNDRREDRLTLDMIRYFEDIASSIGLLLMKKQAEETLKESESRYRSIVEHVNDAYYIHDFRGKILDCNENASRMLGYSREELLNKSLADFDSPDDASLMPERMQFMMENGYVVFEGHHIGKDGVVVPVSVSARVVSMDGEGITQSFVRDITEQKQTELALRESEEKFSMVFRDAPVLISVTDMEDQKYLDVNEEAVRVSGFTREEILGHTSVELGWMTAEDRERVTQELKKHGRITGMEVPVHTKDGRTLYIQLNGEIMTLGGRQCLVIMSADATERKKAEEALIHSHNLMSYIIEHNRSAVAVHDRDMKYIYVSQSYLDDYNIKDKDIIGRHHYEVFPDLPQKWRDVHQRALQGEVISAEDDIYDREDGTREWTRWECRPWYEADGSVGGIIVYTEVITQRKEVEEALRKSELSLMETARIAKVGGWEVDLSDNKLSWTKETFRIHELESTVPPDISGAIQYYHPDDRQKVADAVQRAINSGEDFDFEARLITACNNQLHVRAIGHIVYKDGKAHVLQGMIQDITDLKEAEDAQKESEELLRAFMDNVPSMVIIKDDELRPIFFNKKFLETHPGEDWLGKTPHETFPPEVADAMVKADRQALKERFLFYEEQWDYDNSMRRTVETRKFRIEREEKPPYLGAIITDITERKEAEDALRTSQEHLTRAELLGEFGSWEIDLDTRMVSASQGAISIYGPWGEVLTLDTIEQAPLPEYRPMLEAAMQRLVSKDEPYDIEYRIKRENDGAILDIHSVARFDKTHNMVFGVVQDITERKRTEQALWLANLVYQSSLAAISTADLNGIINSANPAFLAVWGYSSIDEVIGRPISDFLASADEIQAIMTSLSDKGAWEGEFQAIRGDGSTFTGKSQATNLRDRDGKFVGYQSSVIDVTKQKDAVQALQESEQKFRGFIEQSTEGFVLSDETGLVLEWNAAQALISGIPRESALGKYLWEIQLQLMPTEDRSEDALLRIKSITLEILQTGQIPPRLMDSDWVIHRMDGGTVFVQETLFAIKTEMGYRLAAITRDFTERKKAEEALRESETLYHNLVETSQDLIWQCDSEGRYTFLNPAWEEVFGYKVEEMLGRKFTEFQTPETAAIDIQTFTSLMKGDPIRGYESIHLDKDGNEINLVFNAKAVKDKDGKITGTHGTAYDITERKKAEEALRESETRWQFALTGAGDGVWDWNAETNKVFFSAQWKAMLGYEESEVGDSLEEWDKRVHPDDKEQCHKDLNNHLNGETPVYTNEHRMLCKDGSYKWILDCGKVIERTDDGKPKRIIGTHTDITVRKRAEEALVESERALRESQMIAGLGSYVLDIRTGKWVSSDVLDNIFGIRDEYPHTIEGWVGLIHPDHQEMMGDYFTNEVAGKGSRFDKEYKIIRQSDGAERWLHGLGELEFDADGRPIKMYGSIVDITQRRWAEDALRESEARVRTLISSMSEGVCFHEIIRDENGEPINYKIIDLNSQYEEITGLQKESVLGKLATEAYGTPEPPYLKEFTSPCKTMKSAAMETYFPPMDKHFIISIAPLTPDSFATIFFDISEQKRAEEAIRASEANYRTIFDTAGDAMIVYNSDTGEIVDVNRKCCEMFGYTRKEMRGLITADISANEPAYSQENAIRWMQRAMKGKAQLFEWRCKDRSGQVFWVEISLKRVTISGEHRVIAAMRDITQRKHFEEALAARAFWEGIAHTMHNGMVVLAPNGTLSFANESFYNLVGYSSDELVGTPPPYAWTESDKRDDPLLIPEETRNQQSYVIHKSGKHIPVVVNVSDLKDEEGNVTSRFAVYQDISNLVAMEEQLARSERLALLGQLAGSIGHELRNPLGVVQSSVYYLRSKLKDQDEKIDRHLDRLENSVAFSDKVITDLLSFARVPNLDKQPMNMGMFIKRLLEEFTDNEKVTTVLDVETDNSIMADETQMTQLFRNLISNAYDAMTEGGELSIAIRETEEKMMEISISDTGQGMTSEVLAKAFEPLYTTKARGAGFGLSICRKIAESHGGSINITSEPGRGTQAFILLPM